MSYRGFSDESAERGRIAALVEAILGARRDGNAPRGQDGGQELSSSLSGTPEPQSLYEQISTKRTECNTGRTRSQDLGRAEVAGNYLSLSGGAISDRSYSGREGSSLTGRDVSAPRPCAYRRDGQRSLATAIGDLPKPQDRYTVRIGAPTGKLRTGRPSFGTEELANQSGPWKEEESSLSGTFSERLSRLREPQERKPQMILGLPAGVADRSRSRQGRMRRELKQTEAPVTTEKELTFPKVPVTEPGMSFDPAGYTCSSRQLDMDCPNHGKEVMKFRLWQHKEDLRRAHDVGREILASDPGEKGGISPGTGPDFEQARNWERFSADLEHTRQEEENVSCHLPEAARAEVSAWYRGETDGEECDPARGVKSSRGDSSAPHNQSVSNRGPTRPLEKGVALAAVGRSLAKLGELERAEISLAGKIDRVEQQGREFQDQLTAWQARAPVAPSAGPQPVGIQQRDAPSGAPSEASLRDEQCPPIMGKKVSFPDRKGKEEKIVSLLGALCPPTKRAVGAPKRNLVVRPQYGFDGAGTSSGASDARDRQIRDLQQRLQDAEATNVEYGQVLAQQRQGPAVGPARREIRARPYKMGDDWEAYVSNFARIADRNQWASDEAADQLRFALDIRALELATQVNTEVTNCQSFPSLVRMLNDVFVPAYAGNEAGTEFLERYQKDDESFQDYYLNLCRLYRKAHPNDAQLTANREIHKQFVRGLEELELTKYLDTRRAEDPNGDPSHLVYLASSRSCGERELETAHLVNQIKKEAQAAGSAGILTYHAGVKGKQQAPSGTPAPSASDPAIPKDLKAATASLADKMVNKINVKLQELEAKLEEGFKRTKPKGNQGGGRAAGGQTQGQTTAKTGSADTTATPPADKKGGKQQPAKQPTAASPASGN